MSVVRTDGPPIVEQYVRHHDPTARPGGDVLLGEHRARLCSRTVSMRGRSALEPEGDAAGCTPGSPAHRRRARRARHPPVLVVRRALTSEKPTSPSTLVAAGPRRPAARSHPARRTADVTLTLEPARRPGLSGMNDDVADAEVGQVARGGDLAQIGHVELHRFVLGPLVVALEQRMPVVRLPEQRRVVRVHGGLEGVVGDDPTGIVLEPGVLGWARRSSSCGSAVAPTGRARARRDDGEHAGGRQIRGAGEQSGPAQTPTGRTTRARSARRSASRPARCW